VLSIARRQRLLPTSLASGTPARSADPGRVLVVSDSVSDLLDEEVNAPRDETPHDRG